MSVFSLRRSYNIFCWLFCWNPFEARRRRKNSGRREENRITQEIIKRGNCQKIMIYGRFSNLFLFVLCLTPSARSFDVCCLSSFVCMLYANCEFLLSCIKERESSWLFSFEDYKVKNFTCVNMILNLSTSEEEENDDFMVIHGSDSDTDDLGNWMITSTLSALERSTMSPGGGGFCTISPFANEHFVWHHRM